MTRDPTLDEIHAIRKDLSRASGDDIRRIAEAAQARRAQSGRKAASSTTQGQGDPKGILSETTEAPRPNRP